MDITGASSSDSIAPHRFTQDECEFFNDKINRCRKQTSRVNHIQWHTLAYIFEEAANRPLQSVNRTIWPRTEDRLQNWYDNNFRPALKKQRLEGDQVPNSQPQLIINSSSIGSAVHAEGLVSSGSLVVDMPQAVDRHYRNDDLTTDEETFIINTGKNMKMNGQQVNGANLSTSYCRHYLLWKRDSRVLADKWQKWFRNQKKSKTGWYKEYKKQFPSGTEE